MIFTQNISGVRRQQIRLVWAVRSKSRHALLSPIPPSKTSEFSRTLRGAVLVLHLHKNLLPIEPPGHHNPQRQIAQREGQRSIPGLRERSKPMAKNPALDPDAASALTDLEDDSRFGEEGRERVHEKSVRPQP